MAYQIYKSDGSAVTVPDNAIDTVLYDPAGGGGFGPGNVPQTGHGLGTQLIGRNTVGYGAAIAQNFLQLQENFSSSTVPSDAFALQGQLWFKQNSVTAGQLYVRTSGATTGGIANWQQLLAADSSGNLTVSGTVTASKFIGPATSIFGGSPGQLLYQFGASNTAFIAAPSSAGTFLQWTGSAFTWASASTTGTVSSVGLSSIGTYASAVTVGATPVTTSGTITITPNIFTPTTPGVIPGSGGGTTNFLRADGTWAVPPASGGVGSVSSVNVTSNGASAASLTVAGGPVTTTGTITITPNLFSSSIPGMTPSSGGGTTNFLRADGSWVAPPNAGGSVTSVAVSGGSTGLITSGGPITGTGTITLSGTLNVGNGGTGVTTITTNGVVLGNGTSGVTATAAGTTSQVLIGNTGAAPTWSTSPTLSSVLFASGGGSVGGTSGVLVVNSAGIAVTGAITATGDITGFFSDRRLKENVTPIANAMDKVETLNGIRYTPNALAATFGYDRNEAIVGLFADEVQAVLPEAVKRAPFDIENGVSKTGENYMTIQYEKLVPLLVEAIKELNARLAKLEGK